MTIGIKRLHPTALVTLNDSRLSRKIVKNLKSLPKAPIQDLNQPIYIAGKVTNTEYAETARKFYDAEKELRQAGFNTIVNPIRIVPRYADWNNAMRICISELMKCRLVFVLPNTTDSKGTELELNIANQLEIPAIHLTNLDLL